MHFIFGRPSCCMLIPLTLAFWLVSLLTLGLHPLSGEGTSGEADAAEIERLIQQLGSPKFEEREDAAKRLEAIGEPALETLEKAAEQSKDVEIRRRAQAVVQAIEKRITNIRLVVQAMPAPKPALKYQLLPELKEMNPGNPIQNYFKCFMEQQNFFFNKTSADNRDAWQTMPLKDLPLNELRGYGGAALRQADYAARLDTPDWQILLKAKSDGPNLLLPDVQQLRLLASALMVRFRGEVAERHFDEAIRTAKTMLALARHLGEHPSLIGDLVGIAIAYVTIGPLEEMINQPGCPNLYWALTDLPNPLIDLRKGLQGERMLWESVFTGIDPTAAMSEAQLKKVLERIAEMTQGSGFGITEDRVAAARKRLIEAGLTEERVKEFPALQVVLLDAKHQYEVRRDDGMKWMTTPYWQAEVGLLASEAIREGQDTLFGRMLLGPFKVRKAQARLEQRIALLRHVETIRLYAADHDGKLPARLDDIQVPLPVDPFTGKPFNYKVEGQKAVLRTSPPKGEEANPAYNVRYVITIRKSNP